MASPIGRSIAAVRISRRAVVRLRLRGWVEEIKPSYDYQLPNQPIRLITCSARKIRIKRIMPKTMREKI